MTDQKIENLMLEEELMKLLDVNKQALDNLRYKEQLPFIKVTKTTRLYLEKDIMEWLVERRTVLNSTET